MQQQPQRTCIGCRAVVDQNQLMRWVVREKDGKTVPVPDPARRLAGRGAWLHPNPECAQRAAQRGAFARSYRTTVDASSLLAERGPRKGPNLGNRPLETSNPESGTEI